MKIWVLNAFLSMLFAGVTSVMAKQGLSGISADLGLAVRTGLVFVMTTIFACFAVPQSELASLKIPNWLWLGASALTTTASWIFFYRAIKDGEVSTVALIDKGSVVVAVVLAVWLLNESITIHKAAGAALVLAGLLLIARG
ncbi:MAG: EamA family transporter [Candidatus Melainabacteria bacterium]|nr:EamA family transporter [Candidatus Melainabacteria bacterium]